MKLLRRVALAGSVLFAAFIAVQFPYATDAPLTSAEVAKSAAFYQQAYAAPAEAPAADEDLYVQAATAAAEGWHIKDRLTEFAAAQHLESRRVLEVGSGRGYLQDVVTDYTGLDISPSVKRFYHKPFILGSATSLPFQDNSYDALWSIWVIEHVPNPEQAFREMRRVVKNDGLLYLFPAWSCKPWAADGYDVRPYSDFDPGGMLIKMSIPLRNNNLYQAAYTAPIRTLRWLSYATLRGPTTLHYHRLTPNYDKFWEGDGDAVNSLDRYEALLWFLSRGDECLNCTAPSLFRAIAEHVTDPRLIIRVHKS
ncbi:MAG TPA: class I SAM-dependent methyltransferase [Bryobacteraceae bacterium]|nr:class I SAM-dependent methyltransferase [Bryobacteraceae bacterium]